LRKGLHLQPAQQACYDVFHYLSAACTLA
jgi:hypothetical protein